MNKYNLKVGDVINTDFKHQDEIITKVDVVKADLWLSETGWWSIKFTTEHIDAGTWKIVSQVNKQVMSDKIEVGDTVEITDRSSYNTKVRVGDKGIVTKVTEDKVYANFKGVDPINQVGNLYQVKLVSKAKSDMKQIIGYDIKPQFKSKSLEISVAINGNNNPRSPYMPVTGSVPDAARNLGVLDLWFEPVYKSSEVVVKLSSNRTATITSKTTATITMGSNKAEIVSGNVGYTLKMLSELGKIGGYNVAVKEFNLGCQTFTIEDLVAVNQAFVEFK